MKEEKLHNTDLEKRLQQSAENFEMQPSESVWEHVSASLPSGRKRFYFLRWAAVAAIFLLLAGAGWYFLNRPSNQKEISNPSSLVLSDTVQNVPGRKDQNRATGRKDAKIAVQKQKEKHPNVSKKEISKSSQGNAGQQKEAVYAASQPDKASPGQLTPVKSNESPVTVNDNLPVLERINRLSASENFDQEMPLLHYSDRIIQLMLDAAHPEMQLIAGNNSSSPEKNKITVGLFFTPGLSYRTLKTGSPSGSGGQRFASPTVDALRPGSQALSSFMQINRNDKPLQQKQSWGWGSGVRVALHLPHNWMLKSGLSLRHTKYDITAYRQDPAYVYNSGSAYTLAASSLANSNYARYSSRYSVNDQVTTLENSYLSTELPLLIGRRFGGPDEFSFTILAGAGLTYLVHSNSVMYAPDSQRYFTDEDYLNPFNSSLILEANVNIPLSNNLGFSIGPAFQYQLFSSYKNYDPVKEFPYLIGLKSAFYIK